MRVFIKLFTVALAISLVAGAPKLALGQPLPAGMTRVTSVEGSGHDGVVDCPPMSAVEPSKNFAGRGWNYRIPLKQWANVGVTTSAPATDAEAMQFELAGYNGPEYWLGLKNFYVITRYNLSFYYAMAAWQLSQAIEAQNQW